MIPHNPERPVVVRVANFQSVSSRTRHSTHVFRLALTKPGKWGVPDVVLGCEASDFDAERLAEELGWEAIQYGFSNGAAHDPAKAGSVVAWNAATGHQTGRERLLLGSPAGEGIRARYVVQAPLAVNNHAVRFAGGHAPPDRAPKGQASWLDRVRLWRGVLGGDFNTHRPRLRRMFGRKILAVGVLALLVPRHIPCSAAAPVDVDGDHMAFDVVLWPNHKET